MNGNDDAGAALQLLSGTKCRYKWLDSYIPGTAPAVITKKLILDQFVLSPYLIMLFFTGMSIMENSENIFLDVQTKFISTFYKSCMFWLPAQSINFMFIMPKYRVLYMGICGFLWVNILCWAKRQK
ncbi:mpv17-like protein [Teleopsis dalmanni]|uniref:mpv17-like protein n=1 Tax=Teleopsis dalmanni TaxID=139649 RepID=UPI0018CFA292|nr:mpv17-like protein [Teleopsis dalmanni]